jgi:hypothetical protein
MKKNYKNFDRRFTGEIFYRSLDDVKPEYYDEEEEEIF